MCIGATKVWGQICTEWMPAYIGQEGSNTGTRREFPSTQLRSSLEPRAPGPDGIHNDLLKHLPEGTLQILKEILNRIWTSADFPQQWRAATVIPIPKPNKDRTDPLSYRPMHWPAVYARFWSAWLTPASSGTSKNKDTRQKPVWLQKTS